MKSLSFAVLKCEKYDKNKEMLKMKYQINALKTEAVQVKNFIEKNRKIPKACTLSTGETISPYSVAYLLSKMIKDNLQHLDYNLINVIIYNPMKQYIDTIIDEDVLKDDYLVMVQNFLRCPPTNR